MTPRTRDTKHKNLSIPLSLRADGEGAGFDGYASTFWHVDSYGETFAPGAWTDSIAQRGDRVKVLWQHNPDWPIGKPSKLEEDAKGLAVSASILESTQYGAEAMALLRGGVSLDLSVGFRTISERKATETDPLIFTGETPEWVKRNPVEAVWVIDQAALWEFSVVTFPANPMATIDAVRSEQRAALASLLDDLRAGRLDAAGRAVVEEIAAAWSAGAASGGGDPAPAPRGAGASAPHRRLDLDVLVAEFGHLLGDAA